MSAAFRVYLQANGLGLASREALRGLDPAQHLVLVKSRDGRFLEEDDIVAAMTEDIAVLMLPSAVYRSAQALDVARLTRAAHERGILAGFDLAHSIGVMPHALDDRAAGVDAATLGELFLGRRAR
jgi:kynureninase